MEGISNGRNRAAAEIIMGRIGTTVGLNPQKRHSRAPFSGVPRSFGTGTFRHAVSQPKLAGPEFAALTTLGPTELHSVL